MQVNGKFRDKVSVPADTDKDKAEALALKSEKVKSIISGHTIKKVIYVPGKLINIVI